MTEPAARLGSQTDGLWKPIHPVPTKEIGKNPKKNNVESGISHKGGTAKILLSSGGATFFNGLVSSRGVPEKRVLFARSTPTGKTQKNSPDRHGHPLGSCRWGEGELIWRRMKV